MTSLDRVRQRARLRTQAIRTLRVRGHRGHAAALTALVLPAAMVIGGWVHPQQRPGVSLEAAAAWLPSEQLGELTLIDGPSATRVAGVKVSVSGDHLTSVQRGLTGYVLDHRTGRLSRIDGATQEASHPVTVTTSDPSAATLLSAVDGVLVVPTAAGPTDLLDPRTLVASRPPTAGNSLTGSHDVLTDTLGRPWSLDPVSGTAVRITDGLRLDTGPSSKAGSFRLAAAGTVPAVADLSARRVRWFNEDGSTRHDTVVPAQLGPSTVVSADPTTGVVYALDPVVRTLVICRPTRASCELGERFAAASEQLGAMTVARSHVLVPDLGHGDVWILDAGGHVLDKATLFRRPAHFDLIDQGGIVFFNEPTTNQAGILDLDGHVRPVLKYNITPPPPAAGRPTKSSPSTPRPKPSTESPPHSPKKSAHTVAAGKTPPRPPATSRGKHTVAPDPAPTSTPPTPSLITPQTAIQPQPTNAQPTNAQPTNAQATITQPPSDAGAATATPTGDAGTTGPTGPTGSTAGTTPATATDTTGTTPTTATGTTPATDTTGTTPATATDTTGTTPATASDTTGTTPVTATDTAGTTPATATSSTTTSSTTKKTTSSGSISGPGGDAMSCAYFSGQSDLADGKTLILAKKNLSNGDSHEYVEYVFGWDKPLTLSSWRGAQYFKNADGQQMQVRLIAVDLAAAQAANGNNAAADGLVSGGQDLGSVTFNVVAGVGPGSGICPG